MGVHSVDSNRFSVRLEYEATQDPSHQVMLRTTGMGRKRIADGYNFVERLNAYNVSKENLERKVSEQIVNSRIKTGSMQSL